MQAITFVVLLLAIATFGIMVAGSVSMFRGGKYDWTHALPLMEARVIVQGIAIALLVIAVCPSRPGISRRLNRLSLFVIA